MIDSGAFFRRNKKVFWFIVAAFVATFVSIQLSKVFATLGSNYGEIAECTYTHQAPELQTPLSARESLTQYCANRS